MNKSSFVLWFVLVPALGQSQTVLNSSYVTSTGERVLRIEGIIPMSKQDAWKLFSTEQGLKKWIAPVVSLDWRVGGEILTNYDSTKSVRDSGTIRLPIINYLEGEMLTLKVLLNKNFPEKARQEDQNLQEIIQLVDLGDGKTKMISSMIGWGSGPEWDKTYEFFRRGNEWTCKRLVKAAP
ncbi:MAG: SRPBCC domain-containing protein [Bacteroidota bacterium]